MLCRSGLDRRATLKLVASGGVALAGIKSFVPSARAATALTLWTGYPELVPYYKAVAEAYAGSNPGFSLEVLSTTLREAEQKLAAALPTGTGPDIFDAGTAVSIKFITAGLLEPNPPAIDQYMKSGAWDDFTVNFLSVDGKTYGLPLLEGRAAMYYNKAMLAEAGLAGPPSTFPELMDAAVKLTRRDADGKMTRSGISMRLSGQGSGICEKFRFVLEPAGGSLLVPAGNGKWHSGFDNEAGRGALQFYVDVVQKEKVDDPRVPHDAQAFVTGATAMLFREAWVIGEVREKAPNLEFGVAPIPAWTAGGQKKAIVQPWPIYVSSQSENQEPAWDFLQFLTNVENAFLLTKMSGWSSRRKGVDWSPLLAEIPQFETFVSPPADVVPFVDPVLPVFDEIQTRIAERLPGLYVDPDLNGNPDKVAAAIHELAELADGILKQADLYG
jgi:multiple sugar transport system substrate-binding protein